MNFVLIVFAVVTSNWIAHTKSSINTQASPNCSITNCIKTFPKVISPTPISAPTPNLVLTDKGRFLATIKNKLPVIPQPGTFEYILLRKYSAAFINSQPGVKLPPKVLFADEEDVKQYQDTLTKDKVEGTDDCYLQKTAADALNKVEAEIHISTKGNSGSSDCTRSYATNLRFWQKYTDDQTLERVKKGEEEKILDVVAPPGSSQHIWGLAIDLQVLNQAQKEALYKNGWFQTVEYDTPHWTYLGLPEEKLRDFGLIKKVINEVAYWVPPLEENKPHLAPADNTKRI